MEHIPGFLQQLAAWNIVLFTAGDRPVRVSTVLLTLLAVLALMTLSRRLQRWLTQTALRHTRLDRGSRESVAALVRYAVLLTGFVVILQTYGVKLTAFNVLAGALGVGIGFGLQNIVSNFISGFIVMLQRPVRIGDRIDIAGIEGNVIDIGARTTTLLTARRATVYVPNQKFITDNVRNWDIREGGGATSLLINLKSKSEHDARQVERILQETAREDRRVLGEPPPVVNLVSIGAGGNAFELEAWVNCDAQQRAKVLSDLQFRLLDKLREQGIELA